MFVTVSVNVVAGKRLEVPAGQSSAGIETMSTETFP